MSTKTTREIEIKPITGKYRDANNHKKIRWSFDQYEIFEIVKNITKSESELANMTCSPIDAIIAVLKIINRRFRAKPNMILTWKVVGYSKTQQSYIRDHREGQAFEKIDIKGNVLLGTKTLIKFDEMEDLVPQIKTESIREENTNPKNFKLQKTGDMGEM